MRLLLTVVPERGEPADVAVRCDPDALVGDVARHLADLVAGPGAAGARRAPSAGAADGLPAGVVVRDTGRRFGIVEEASGPEPVARADATPGPDTLQGTVPNPVPTTVPNPVPNPVPATRPGPALVVDGRVLDPEQPVVESPLRHGAIVGLGAPPAVTAAEPTGVVELRVVSGPGAGTVRRLGVGSHLVGPQPGASLVLPPGSASVRVDVDVAGTATLVPEAGHDETVAPPSRTMPLEGPVVVPRGPGDVAEPVRRGRRRTAPEVAVPGQVQLDPEAERAAVELERRPLTGPVAWEPGRALTVGPCLLELTTPSPPDASLSASPAGATMDLNRPPRLLPAPRTTEFALPKEPARPSRQPIPFLVVLAPMVMGVGMYFVTQRIYTLLFVALSPLLMIANWWQGRRSQSARYAEQLAEHVRRRTAVEAAAAEALELERAARRGESPDPAELLLQATGPRARLWERRRTDPDWLVVRVGTADQPSEVRLADPSRERHQGALTWTAPDVPVTVALGKAGVTGVAGPQAVRDAVADGVLAQVAVLHSPADLAMVVLAADGAARRDWLRWLPHLRTADSSDTLAAIGTDDETTSRRLGELTALLEHRRQEAADGRAAAFAPVLVVLDGARTLRLAPGMVPLLREGPSLGLVFLCLDDDVRLLPEECQVVVDAGADLLRVTTTGRGTVEAVRPDLVPDGWAERVARALAPVRDVSAAGEVARVPATSRLLDVLRLNDPTGEQVAARWRQGGRTTTAVIGEDADGPFSIDLRRDGPHGLVAGTTGSGKSELLQTLIASLAVANRPDEMTFVLVDYKGGAAFKDCAHLPHTVGMVTDLDGHLTGRALESLGAELRRREHQLADAGAKDIEDYLAARGPGDLPMPRLVLVIDEFAAMVSELPDFVTGLVDIARRGRSLGVHLVLATQRPAGVVSAEIKSNTNLRIALRVTDPGDSQDVVESDAAARIEPTTPGRAYARLGHSQLLLFQAARVGGRPRGDAPAQVSVRPLAWSTLGTPAPRLVLGEQESNAPTDLSVLVGAVTQAAGIAGVEPQPSPWLPALPERVLLADHLPGAGEGDGTGREVPAGPRLVPAAARAGRDVPAVPLGLADLPSAQRQETMTWDLARAGHLAVAGQARSGRSSVLRLVAAGLAELTDPRDVHVYGLDCGNGALLPLVAMPHVGAVVTRDQPDRVRRLLTLLGTEVARRQQLLARGGYADVAEQRAAASAGEELPYLVLLLDRWEGFLGAFEQSDGGQLVEQVVSLLREGQAVGLRGVLTGDRSLLIGRMGAVLEDRLLLRMASADDFSLVGIRQCDVPTRIPAGRGFRSGEHPTEVQTALLTADPAGTAQVAALQEVARRAATRAGHVPAAQRPRRVDELPLVVTLAEVQELRETAARPGELLVGVGGDTLASRGLDVADDGPGLLVVGPPRSGRSSALMATVEDALGRGWRVSVVAPRRSPLRELEGRRGVRAVLGADAPPDDLTAALDSSGPRLLVIDDFEVLGAEHALAAVAEDYLKRIRDSGDAIAVACGVDEVSGMYRGVTATMRKARTGVILAPRSSADGDVLSVRLPRSVGGPVPPGRAVLVRAGGWEWVQVPVLGV